MHTLLSDPRFLLSLSLCNALLLMGQLALLIWLFRQYRALRAKLSHPDGRSFSPEESDLSPDESDFSSVESGPSPMESGLSPEESVIKRRADKAPDLPVESASFRERMEALIRANLHNPEFTVDDLAKELYVSRSGLFVKVKDLTGNTPNHLIINARLEEAARLLRESGRPVGEICFMVGFSSPSYFSKCFYRRYGMTPYGFARLPGPKSEQ